MQVLDSVGQTLNTKISPEEISSIQQIILSIFLGKFENCKASSFSSFLIKSTFTSKENEDSKNCNEEYKSSPFNTFPLLILQNTL